MMSYDRREPIELYPDRDLRDICDNSGLIPFYIEHRFTRELEAGVYDAKQDIFYFTSTGNWMDNEGQGGSWRPWLGRPTDLERAAAPWKKLPDEGLTWEESHKTPDEIKKALKLCYEDKYVPKGECPYASTCEECGDSDGFQRLKADALACIETLEEQVMLMKLQMRGDCGVCLHKAEASACDECMRNDERPLWEYEGLPEVKKNA